MMDRESLSEWAKDKPLSILQLDPADRAVLRIAGKSTNIFPYFSLLSVYRMSIVLNIIHKYIIVLFYFIKAF